jgi:hypothetical protein
MEREGRRRRPGTPKNQESAHSKEQDSYHTESTANNPSGTLNSIRADQDVETFVADLRQNKEQLLSLAQGLMRNRGNTWDEQNAYLSLEIYLDVVLKAHVFDIDPFVSKRPGDEDLQEAREVLAFDLITRAASRWLKTHPSSKAANAVSKMGHNAFSDQHHELLHEMWPSIRLVASHSEKKK